ncbi:hypothetical protein [Streptomyces sp. NPDC097619]|uniref:hypothetical protein n=1 Tax=Streptomyces sp. NPDC097619 TaxID=3157228 RepID=UPI00331FDE76
MDIENGPGLRRQLVAAVGLLATHAAPQAEWVARYGVHYDEIALNFDDAAIMAPQLAEADLIDPVVLEGLARIDALFFRLAEDGDDDVWTAEALDTDPLWEEIRQEARSVLKDLGAEAPDEGDGEGAGGLDGVGGGGVPRPDIIVIPG